METPKLSPAKLVFFTARCAQDAKDAKEKHT